MKAKAFYKLVFLGLVCFWMGCTKAPEPTQKYLEIVTGDNQVSFPNDQLNESIYVAVLDSDGEQVPVAIQFSILSGGGSLSMTTDYATNWIVGASGNQVLQISATADGHEILNSPQFISARIIDLPVAGPNLVDARDGEIYTTLVIGNQTWMAENLRFDSVTVLTNPNNPSPVYGRLYKWETAKTVCPAGWHLPSDGEWKTMEMNLGMTAEDANFNGSRGYLQELWIKSNTGWAWWGQGNNKSGFNAYPAGWKLNTGNYHAMENKAHFWTSTEFSEHNARVRELTVSSAGIDRANYSKTYALSCRCVKN